MTIFFHCSSREIRDGCEGGAAAVCLSEGPAAWGAEALPWTAALGPAVESVFRESAVGLGGVKPISKIGCSSPIMAVVVTETMIIEPNAGVAQALQWGR